MSGKVTNFDYCNFEIEKFNFENGNFEFENSEIGYGPPWGGVGGGGVTADDDRGCYDPVYPVLVFFLRNNKFQCSHIRNNPPLPSCRIRNQSNLTFLRFPVFVVANFECLIHIEKIF